MKREQSRRNTELPSEEEYMRLKVETLNETIGELKGCDCPKCLNKGFIAKAKGLELVTERCVCMEIRQSRKRLKESGLEVLGERCSFASFECRELWQSQVRERAEAYLNTERDCWWFIGGQSGSGKTHICTAIVNALIERGQSALYMLWRDEAVRLKGCVGDESYLALMDRYKKCDVLYIDDFFKTGSANKPSEADVNLAVELINYRYNAGRRTVISTELTIDGVIAVDEALGGRIYQNSKGFCINIPRDKSRNYRLR